MDYVLSQAVYEYNIGYLEDYVGELLGCKPSTVTFTHLILRDRKREKLRKNDEGEERGSS